jgi:steroid delta-isomerase-like uncharacterized protein
MDADEHKALLHRWIDAWHAGDVAAVDAFVTPDYVRHDPNVPEVRGREAEKQLMTMYLTAFPDLRFAVEDMVAEGDKVVTRLTARGTHRGELLGVPPTDRAIAITAVEIYRFDGGRIAEQWVIGDVLGLLQQLGAVPAPGQPAP